MILPPQATLVKWGAVALVAAGICFYGYEKGVQKYVALKAEVAAEARAQQKAADDKDRADNYFTKDAYEKLQNNAADLAAANSDLAERLRNHPGPIIVPAPVGSACKPTIGAGPGHADTVPSGTAEPASEASVIGTEVLRDDLTIALDDAKALKAIIQLSREVHAPAH